MFLRSCPIETLILKCLGDGAIPIFESIRELLASSWFCCYVPQKPAQTGTWQISWCRGVDNFRCIRLAEQTLQVIQLHKPVDKEPLAEGVEIKRKARNDVLTVYVCIHGMKGNWDKNNKNGFSRHCISSKRTMHPTPLLFLTWSLFDSMSIIGLVAVLVCTHDLFWTSQLQYCSL